MKRALFLASAAFLIIIGFTLVEQSRVTTGPTSQEAFRPTPLPSQTSRALGVSVEDVWVSRVIDGDTFEVSSNGQTKKVRLVGMDTPETVDPNRPVGCFGKEASDETKSLLTGKEVLMVKDVSETDKYGRLLRYVYLKLSQDQTLFVNDFLVRQGYAKVLTIPPDVKFADQFVQAQREASLQKLGLWSKCI